MVYSPSTPATKRHHVEPTKQPRDNRYALARLTVTQDVVAHPQDLSRIYVERYKVSRVTANKYISQLEVEGWIARSGPKTRPVYGPGYKRKISHIYAIQGLDEQTPWEKDFSPYFQMAANVKNIAHHGFTEMLNNAIDHSLGEQVFVLMQQDAKSLDIVISDNGIGIFAKISEALQLPDMRQAIFELSKGKLTTDPSRHSGEGVFFTSRMFDLYVIEANGLEFNHDEGLEFDKLDEAASAFKNGTTVLMSIALNSERTASATFEEYMNKPEDYGFTKTVVPMRLAQLGDEQLISRSQAKRLIARFDKFKKVVLDFQGVNEIGQAFSDELFRVYGKNNPQIELIPINMNKDVERMWLRVMAPM